MIKLLEKLSPGRYELALNFDICVDDPGWWSSEMPYFETQLCGSPCEEMVMEERNCWGDT
jgi:hypothetical protein